MEDTIKDNIAQMASKIKAYIPYPLSIIIKRCLIITRDRHQHRSDGR